MIKSFRSKETEKIFSGEFSYKLPPDIQKAAIRKLWMINTADSIYDLKTPPSNNLERLKADRVGQYSIRINRQWRICFDWIGGDAYSVEITDYH